MIVNELVSNSLKHAFSGIAKGEISIKLCREEDRDRTIAREENKSEDCMSTTFVMTVSDNGIGIPENTDIEDIDGLGLQLVNSLVDQLDGELELKRSNGTEFTIKAISCKNTFFINDFQKKAKILCENLRIYPLKFPLLLR